MRNIPPLLLTLFLAFMTVVSADTITVDGVTYRDVEIIDSGTRYYWRTNDGKAMSVEKEDVPPGNVQIGDAPPPEEEEEEEEPAAEVSESPEPTAVEPPAETMPVAVDMPEPAPVQAGAATTDLLRAGREGLEANALVLRAGEHMVGVVSLDLAAVDAPLVDRIADNLAGAGSKLTRDNLIVAATGGVTQAQQGILKGELQQTFLGDYVAEAAQRVTSVAAEALRTAEEQLAPAQLQMAETQLADLHESRFGPEASIDNTLNVLAVASPEGVPVAYLVNYPLYGVVLEPGAGTSGRRAPGGLAAHLRDSAAQELPVLFINGAAGDTEPDFEQGEEAAGQTLAKAALAALEEAPARETVSLLVTPRRTPLPPTLLSGLVPEETVLHEVHLGSSVFVTAPGSAAAQIGVLLRVKALTAGKEQLFLASHANDYLGLFPTITGFFAAEVESQVNFYGPLTAKWFAEHYLPLEDGDRPAWKDIPTLAKYETTYSKATETTAAQRDALLAEWEKIDEGLNGVVPMAKTALASAGDDLPMAAQVTQLVERLNETELQAMVKQVLGGLVRTQADFSEEERVIMMAAAQALDLPYDAVVLMQLFATPDRLPADFKSYMGIIQASAGQAEGHDFL
ncbi:MAG: hypothetical protein ACLFTT_00430 [Candidatus Hydrogenedentota bacterium]